MRGITLVLVSLLVLNTFFLRGYELPGYFPLQATTSYGIPILTLALIGIAFFSATIQQITVPRYMAICIFLLAALPISIFFLNVILYPHHGAIAVFFLEYYLNIFLFLSIVIAARNIKEETVLNILLIFGVIQSFIVIDIALGIDTIRRIGNTELPIGVNHLSHALGTSFVIGLTKYQYSNRHGKLILLPLLILIIGMVLTGARSNIIGVFIAVVVMFSLQNRSRIIENISTIIMLLLGSALVSAIAINLNHAAVARFTEGALPSLIQRFNLYSEALQVLFRGPVTVLTGIGVSNYVLVTGEPLVSDPHNFWISTALYLGIPVAVVFLFLHLLVSKQLVQIIINRANQRETEVAILLMLIVVSSYIFFSGRLTRIYTIWIILGLGVSRYIKYLDCS